MKPVIHFLSGLPRSGNTLLSAILNQNPNIYSSPLSPLNTLMYETAQVLRYNENSKRSPEVQFKIENLLKEMPYVYYQNIKKPIIFDREKVWGTPANLALITQFITPQPKIIYSVRDLPSILASYLFLDFEKQKEEYRQSNYYDLFYLPFEDGYLDYLMRPNGDLNKSFLSLANLLKETNCNFIHLVEYENLTKDPQLEMDKIYSFLEIPSYTHDFNNIQKQELDFDEANGHPKDMHKIQPKLTQSKTNSTNLLSPYILSKYSDMNFWRETSSMKLQA